MVTMLIFYRRQKELDIFKKLGKELFARLSEDQLELRCFSASSGMMEYLRQGPLVDLFCAGITGPEEITLLRRVRRMYEKADFLLIADDTISPMEYLVPGVRASSLLLYPYRGEQHRQVFLEFMQNYLESLEKPQDQQCMVLENREGRTVIPFRQIYYIEVRERKVFIRIRNKEYSRYDSLEHMLEGLPDYFIRCHRSFVFNRQHLERVRLSENAVYLEHGIMVPLSRSYKPAVKACMYDKKECGNG